MIREFEGKSPSLGEEVFLAEDCVVVGDVALGRLSSVWYGAVVRGDVHSIRIGEATNIQDRCVVHVTHDRHPTVIGDYVTVGHSAVVHGCRIGSRTLVGIGAVVLDGVEVGEGTVIAAGSLLPPGRRYPPDSLVVGSPASARRSLSDSEKAWILASAESYVALARRYRAVGPKG
jgi:carbonic anhydrase/acetyltransferase-like protein (isoleucine patch superfamily)